MSCTTWWGSDSICVNNAGIGNVILGMLICLTNIMCNTQVVLAYGAESDRVLGIPGEVCFACFGFVSLILWCSLINRMDRIATNVFYTIIFWLK